MQDAMAKCGATVSAQATIRRVGRFNERMTAAAADVAIVMASKFDHARGSTSSSISSPSHHPTTTFAVTPGTRSVKKSGGAMSMGTNISFVSVDFIFLAADLMVADLFE